MSSLFESAALLLALLNPFLLVVYITGPLKQLSSQQFSQVLLRAGIIASVVFCCFAILGDTIFSRFFKTEFASFQIFGGIIFLLIGLQFVFKGPTAIEILRGEAKHLSGAIAMPVLIGPGTISASVVIGGRHSPLLASSAVVLATFGSLAIVVLLKKIHDYVLPRNEVLVDRYVEITGRITALYIGTVAVDMIMQGFSVWLKKFGY